MDAIHPIILCGGSGTRLWPASTPTHPKPFMALAGELSLFQHAARRLVGLAGADAPVVVVGALHAALARAQMSDIGVEGFIISEPEGRDSGPALLAAALWIARRNPTGIAVAVASDHHIPDDGAFRASVRAALIAAGHGEIVTFGVKPTFAATAYGYIRPGEMIDGGAGARRVGEFIEKPDARRARAFVRTGYLWNSGNFVFRVDALLAQASLHAPALAPLVERAILGGVEEPGLLALGRDFAAAPRISIDVAVLEKTARAAVLEIDYPWSDLGSWDAVWAASPHDDAGNAISGRAVVVGSAGCLIQADADVEVVAVGLKNLAVVARGGRVLVCDLAASQAVKAALETLAVGKGGVEPAPARPIIGKT